MWVLILSAYIGHAGSVVAISGYSSQPECAAAGAAWTASSKSDPRTFACVPGPRLTCETVPWNGTGVQTRCYAPGTP